MRGTVLRAGRVTVLAVVLAAVAAPEARAGGNWLDFRRESQAEVSETAIFAPGERVVAFANVYAQGPFRRRILGRGPFLAWLEPEAIRYGGPSEAVPRALLGTFQLWRLSAHAYRASVHFTVPVVPLGTYAVTICNDPCVHRGLGEGVMGWIDVVATPQAARLRSLARERGWAIRDLRGALDRARDRQRELRVELDGSHDQAAALSMALTIADRRADRLRALANRSAIEPRPGRRWDAWFAVVAAVLLLIGLVTVGARRRRAGSSVRVPDSPAELVDDERPVPALNRVRRG